MAALRKATAPAAPSVQLDTRSQYRGGAKARADLRHLFDQAIR